MTNTANVAMGIMLAKFLQKGWNLYSAVFSTAERDVEPIETIKKGPASELMLGNLYILLPATEDPKDPEQVFSALEELMDKIKGKPILAHGYQPVELLAFTPREDDIQVPLQRKKYVESLEGPYKSIAIPYAQFLDSLDFFLDTKKPKQINYSNIDQPIRHLIYKLNKVPFLKTLKSRSGRLRQHMKDPALFLEGKEPIVEASEDCGFITGGYLLFEITDFLVPEAAEFMAEVKRIAEDYHFVTMENNNARKYKMNIDCTDLTRSNEIKDDDDAETKIRKKFEVRKYQAQERIKEFLEIKNKLEELAEKYRYDS